MQNTFATLTDVEGCLSTSREEVRTRVLPLDFDRSPHADTGYTGWVQFSDGEIYIVNYILDDTPKGQIMDRQPPVRICCLPPFPSRGGLGTIDLA